MLVTTFLVKVHIQVLLTPYPEKPYEDVNKRTIEIPQRTRIYKASHSLKVHKILFKLALSISGICLFIISEWVPLSDGLFWFSRIDC